MNQPTFHIRGLEQGIDFSHVPLTSISANQVEFRIAGDQDFVRRAHALLLSGHAYARLGGRLVLLLAPLCTVSETNPCATVFCCEYVH